MISARPLEEGYKPVYAVKDEMTGFGSPMVYENQQAALRDFAAAAKDPETVINRWKDDYALYRIGQYNPEYGTIIGEIEPILVIRAKCIIGGSTAGTECINGGSTDEAKE